ncbi:MAG: hypothetical protein ACHQQR_03070 [Gemmatimonadales bacterium]
MTSPGAQNKSAVQNRPRRVRIVLRDRNVVEASIFLTEGQALAPYLGTRKGGWVNLVEPTESAPHGARQPRETRHHTVLQGERILFALSPDGDIPVFGSNAIPNERDVDVALEDGSHLKGKLRLAPMQRLADYLHSCGKFLPLLEASLVLANEVVGDCAVNCSAIRSISDAEEFEPGSMAVEDPDFDPRTVADLQIGPARSAPLAVSEPARQELTDAQRAMSQTLAHHWLVQLGTAAGMLPPDPRDLPASPSLEEIWSNLARRNSLADSDLAVQVAKAGKLPVAKLDQPSPEALAAIPARVARKLGVIPLRIDAKNLVVAISDPFSMEIEQQLAFVTAKRLQFQIAPPSEIHGALDWHYKGSAPD